MIILPAMAAAQTNGWHALLDVAEQIPTGWAVVGGGRWLRFCVQSAAKALHGPQTTSTLSSTCVLLQASTTSSPLHSKG